MTNRWGHLTMDEKKLEQVLDIYGADLSKMPQPIANEVKEFLLQCKASSEQKQVPQVSDVSPCVKENITDLRKRAEFIDQALEAHKPLPKWDLEALENKILAKAFASEQQNTAEVIPLKPLEESKAMPQGNKHSSRDLDALNKSEIITMKSMGLIAASLLAGLLIGSYEGLNLFLFEDTTLLASNIFIDDVLYLGTEYSLDTAEFLKN